MGFIGRTTAKTVKRMKEGVKVFDNKIEKLYEKHANVDKKYDILIEEAIVAINNKRQKAHEKVASEMFDLLEAKKLAEQAVKQYEELFTKKGDNLLEDLNFEDGVEPQSIEL